MIQRTLILLLLALLLIGATPPNDTKRMAVLSPDHAIVDDNPILTRGYYPTVQAAINSGAKWIEVLAGEYDGFIVNTAYPITIVMQGARFHNDNDVTIYIETQAEGTTITGKWEIYGDADGTALGDFYHGTGIHNAAAYVTLEGFTCTNLLSFCFLNPTPSGHHVTIRDCIAKNVATSPTPQLLAGTAIIFIPGNHNEVTGCYIEGWSQAIGLWYGASHNYIHNNELVNNYGWIPGGFTRSTVDANEDAIITNAEWGSALKGNGFGFAPRSAIEDYGEPGAENTGNWFYYNTVDGSNASAFELADRLWDVRVVGNEVHNVVAGFWMGGSGGDYSRNALIEGNTFYGHAGVVSNWFSGTGEIKDNDFFNWDETATTGVIYVPSDALGDLLIEGNTFDGGQSPLRYSAVVGTLQFRDNIIQNTDTNSIGLIYLADTPNPNAIISDNLFQNNGLSRVVNQNTNTRVTVEDNVMHGGGLWVGEKSVVTGNEFHSPYDVWTPLYIQSGMIARDNLIFADNTPIVVDGGATGAMIADNFVARLDGTAASLPVCGVNTCRDNWTAP